MTVRAPRVPPEVVRFFQEHQTFYIVGHVDPDGDCLAASLALGSFLRRTLNKQAKVFNCGPFDRREVVRLKPFFRKRITHAERDGDQDVGAVVLDCSEPERVGPIADDLEGLPTVVIDHHATATPFGSIRFVETSAPATCYLIQLLMEKMGPDISEKEAEQLLFGIATDTGYFRHVESDGADLFAAVARLMKVGASPKLTHQQMFGGQTVAARKLLGRLIDRSRFIRDGAAVITWETMEDTAEFGRESRDSDTLYELLFGVKGVRLIGLVRQEGRNRSSGSLRSLDTVDVSEMAIRFGGGGHRRAAGFTVDLPLDEVISKIEHLFTRALK